LTDKLYRGKLIPAKFYIEGEIMEHIKTIETRNLCDSAKNGGCGECQTSCQSACKTSCGIANQKCESVKESK
jgi:predicted ribosomally synthesized six-cysteine peptide SCIFF